MTEFCIDTDTVICLYIYVCDTFTWCLNALCNVNTFIWCLNTLCNVNYLWNVICWLYNLPRVKICNTGHQQPDFCLLPLLCDKRRKTFSTIVDSCIYIYTSMLVSWILCHFISHFSRNKPVYLWNFFDDFFFYIQFWKFCICLKMGDAEVTEWTCFTLAYSGPVCNLTWGFGTFLGGISLC